MAKYLDENGLLYLWGKIKALVSADKIVVDASLNSTSENPVQNKAIHGALNNKVDVVSGKGLSTNDYTTAEKNKLTALPTNAELQSTYATKTDIASMYKYKGSVADAEHLPSSGQTVGDVYNIEASSTYGGTGMNVAWNGTTWDALGEIFAIASITNAEIDNIVV